jgi:hypothetical protein
MLLSLSEPVLPVSALATCETTPEEYLGWDHMASCLPCLVASISTRLYSDWEVGCTSTTGRGSRTESSALSAQSQLETAKPPNPLAPSTECRFSKVISAELEQTKTKADLDDIQYSNKIGRVLLQSINLLSRSTFNDYAAYWARAS